MSSVRRNRSPRTRVAQSEKASAIREAQRVIGQNLRAYYDLAQPVPDRVAELLKQLAQRKNKSESENNTGTSRERSHRRKHSNWDLLKADVSGGTVKPLQFLARHSHRACNLENEDKKVRDGSGQIGVLPYSCDPRRPPPPCRSEIRRYANTRTLALAIITAILARWFHTSLRAWFKQCTSSDRAEVAVKVWLKMALWN
jgi:anti-sigma factor NepR-like protein